LLVQKYQRPKSQVKLCRVLEQAAADPMILQISQSIIHRCLISQIQTFPPPSEG